MSVEAEALPGERRALPFVWNHPRRRALLLAVGLAYLARLLVALLASYPVVASVSASGVLAFESGDGKLFEPGGLYLLEVLVHERAGLSALVAPTAVLLVLGSLAGLAPEWMLLRALAAASPGLAVGPSRALPRLGGLVLASWTARGLLAFATGALVMTAHSYFASARDERLPWLAAGGVVLLGLCGWACLSVLHDLAAIEVTLRGATPLAGIERALGVARRHALALAVRYGAWTLAAGAVLLGGAAAASCFDVSGGGSVASTAALVLHQSVILAQIGLHAAWLWSALRVATPDPRALERAQADAFL